VDPKRRTRHQFRRVNPFSAIAGPYLQHEASARGRDQLLDDGIAAARVDYAKDPVRLAGALEGFDACRGKTPEDLTKLLVKSNRRASRAMDRKDDTLDDYWKARCFALEVEWVCNCVSAATRVPIAGHLPTCRGAMKAAEVLGVEG